MRSLISLEAMAAAASALQEASAACYRAAACAAERGEREALERIGEELQGKLVGVLELTTDHATSVAAVKP
jgi:hypothetical protein